MKQLIGSRNFENTNCITKSEIELTDASVSDKQKAMSESIKKFTWQPKDTSTDLSLAQPTLKNLRTSEDLVTNSI